MNVSVSEKFNFESVKKSYWHECSNTTNAKN